MCIILLLQEAFSVLEQCRFPVIAAVQGKLAEPFSVRQQYAQVSAS
jgi:hypothetical protein